MIVLDRPVRGGDGSRFAARRGIFHHREFGVEVVRDRNAGEEQGQRAGEGHEFQKALAPPASAWTGFRKSLVPPSKARDRNQEANYVEKRFHALLSPVEK